MKSNLSWAAVAFMAAFSSNSLAQGTRTIESVDGNGNVSIEVLSVEGETAVVNFGPSNVFGTAVGDPNEFLLDVTIFDGGDEVFSRLGVLIDVAITPINNLSIVTGQSDDTVFLVGRGQFTGDVVIDTRNGDDEIIVNFVDTVGQLNVRGRAGRDEIEINSTDAGSVFAGLGPGSGEIMSIINSRFDGRASFSGGTGTDTLDSLGGNDFGDRLIIRNFE